MVTYLDLLNEARGLQKFLSLNVNELLTTNGEAVIGSQAVNRVIQNIRSSSVDLDFSEPVQDIVTTSGDNTLLSPDGDNAWNPQMIREMRLVSSTEYLKLDQVTLPKAKELEFAYTNSGKPLYYYVHQGAVKLIPVPDDAYTLKVFYQTQLSRLTLATLTANVTEPIDFHEAIVTGIYAYLRRAEGDPEWRQFWDNDYKLSLNKAIDRNKFNQKSKGKRLFRMRRTVDRRV